MNRNYIIKLLAIIFVSILPFKYGMSQTNLITNGGFEGTTVWTNWASTVANGALFGGPGTCTSHGGSKHVFLGTSSGGGVDLAIEDFYQTVTIPSNTISCVLNLWASINTSESSTATSPFDKINVNIRSVTGSLLYSGGFLSNLQGESGIPGCQTWAGYYINIPSTYYGMTVRISFEFETDASEPTIFRLDDISLIATTNSCTYSLSQSTYTCPSASANSYGNISAISTQSGCTWNPTVTSGSAWLSTSSSGTGNGNISIDVTANSTTSSRTGTINISGQTLTVIQPGSCSYSLSQSTYTCANAFANTISNVATVTTQSGCSWTASVTSGNAWLSTSSSGVGNGTISVIVTQNNSGSQRSGSININGQTLNIIQPVGCIYSLSQNSYNCANSSGNTYPNILLVNTQTGCGWSALVTSGNSWLSSPSIGTGSGSLSISVTENNTLNSRQGTIDINGQTLTITQPGVLCEYALSTSTYTCSNGTANTYSNIATVTAQTVCPWTASVASGNAWLATSSSGMGNGAISIIVLKNNTGNPRTGTISIGGQILTIVQTINVGINEAINLNNISVYPNPSVGMFTIDLGNINGNKTIQILDVTGKQIKYLTTENTLVNLNLTGFAPGIYFLNIETEQGVKNMKVILE